MRFLLLVLLCLGMILPAARAETYRNPMSVDGHYPPIHSGADDYGIGDPFVMRWNGRYYLYASSCEERVRVFTSDNMITWTFEGWCTENRDVYFAYAPEVVYWRGSFYMITSPGGNGHYILKSDSPLGVFRPITNNFGHSIDGSFFVDDNGEIYMLFPQNSVIHLAKLDEETMLPDPFAISTGATLRHWTEGPGLFRRGDWYYLTLTGNHLCSSGYRVAFASRKDSPIGAYYQREDSTLFINSVFGDEFTGLGHSSNVIGPDLDSLYTAYHSFVSIAGPARLYNVDRLLTNGGLLYTTGATNFDMPMPAMPDAYGDIAGDTHDFVEDEEGYFAVVSNTDVFTQECNFSINGGVARWLMGEKEGKRVIVEIDDADIRLTLDGETLTSSALPTLGEEGRLHTLRVEHTPEVLYLYIDNMRLITVTSPEITASRVGALKGDGVTYSFVACTAQALGSGDYAAVKVLPGAFSAIHAVNAGELPYVLVGNQEEKAPVLGSAVYNALVEKDGDYCFDLTVTADSAGKPLSILMGGKTVWQGTVPERQGKDEMYTFTTPPCALVGGEQTMEIIGEGVTLNRVSSFAYAPVQAIDNDFTTKDMRSQFITLGAFNMRPTEGTLRVSPNKPSFALFGEQGMTDYEMTVRFKIPMEGIGSSGILIRATEVSLYDAQVADSYYGYSLSLSKIGVNLRRVKYGAVGSVEFGAVKAWKDQEEGEITLRVKGGVLEVYEPSSEKPLITVADSHPFTHGLYGFFSTGKELTVLSVSVRPIAQ